MAQYIYGKLISSGEIISITEVPKDKALRKPWACVCPKCGTDLMARRGDVREDHFAHKPSNVDRGSGVGCSAESANETALHQMAKEILIKELETGGAQFAVPSIEFSLREMDSNDFPLYVLKDLPDTVECKKAASLLYTKAAVEEWVDGYRPDVIIETSHDKYLIEICVTNRVKHQKAEKAKKAGIPMIEVDLWDVYEAPISREELRERIITSTDCKKWIVRPNEAAVVEWGHSRYKDIADFLAKKYRAEEAAKKEAARRREELFQPKNYEAVLKSLEGKQLDVIKEFWFYKKGGNIPFFVNIPIRGESIFKCDRRVWQGAIFDHFIYNRSSESRSIYIDRIINWAKLYQRYFEVDWSLAKGSTLLGDVIARYLGYLVDLEFLREAILSDKEYILCRKHSIIPPDQEYAGALETAINSLGEGKYSPDVDHLIHEKLKWYYDKRREAARQRKIQEQIAAQERAQVEKEAKINQAKQRILAGDTNQKDFMVYDLKGNRLALCTVCNNMTQARGMKYESGTVFKGICANCRQKTPAIPSDRLEQRELRWIERRAALQNGKNDIEKAD